MGRGEHTVGKPDGGRLRWYRGDKAATEESRSRHSRGDRRLTGGLGGTGPPRLVTLVVMKLRWSISCSRTSLIRFCGQQQS